MVIAGGGNLPPVRPVLPTMSGKALALAALTATLVSGCGQKDDSRRPASEPDAVRATCGDGGARVLTPVAQPRPDGVHLEVTNENDRVAHVAIERNPSGSAGFEAPVGRSTHVLALGPGDWTITCYAEGGGGPATVDVIDTGTWVSTDLSDCEIEEVMHGDPPRRVATDRNDLPNLARPTLEGVVGLEPDAVVEAAGYPQHVEAVFRARAGGRTIATVSFYPDDAGGWLEGEVRSCSDFPVGSSTEGP